MTSTKNSFIRDTEYSTLPTHIITEILKYLTISDFKSATQVCKSWYYASTDPYFIRKPCARITSKHFQAILDYNHRFYSKFIVSDEPATSEHVIRDFLQHNQQHVREIEFLYCYNTDLDTMLNLYVDSLKNLDTLTIKWRRNLFDNVNHCDAMNPIAKLKHLYLFTRFDFCDSDSVKNLFTFLGRTQNLTRLEILSKFDEVYDEFIESFPTLLFLPNLTALTLRVAKYKNFEILLKNLLKINLQNLSVLQVYDAYHSGDEIIFDDTNVEYRDLIEKFSATFINLREFYVGYANDEILRNLFKFMRNLKVLGVSCAHRTEFKEIDIFYVVKKLQINVYTNYNWISGNDRPLESNVYKLFHNRFTNLTELKLNGEMNPETLRGVIQNCPNLKVLHVSGLLHSYNEPHEIYNQLRHLQLLEINGKKINQKTE